jgi:hypothetical protein
MECNEDKIEYIQDKTQARPSNHAIGMSNIKFPTAKKQNVSHQGVGEVISQLPICVNVFHLYISLLYMVSQELVSHFKVFHTFVED